MKKGDVISISKVDYLLIKTIGNGGSGDVWEAQANSDTYAIKIINSSDTDKIERFNKELSFCKNNQNKYIISIIADGEFAGRRYYIMPKYSKTLRNVINEEKDADVLVKYIFQLCNAIKFIHKHRAGVVHRDIKPENILIEGENLVLADFGIAHFSESTLTKKGDLLGNRHYSAPEQKNKNKSENIGKPADIYALGLIINECFTKQNPAGASFKIIADDYPLLYEYDTLVSNMIKQNANERFTIDTVITEFKFKYEKLKQNIQEIKNVLIDNDYPKNIEKKTLNEVIQRASEDLLFANFAFRSKSVEEIRKYNNHWHMNISYNVDNFLFNLCMQEKLLELCKRKFYYESQSSYEYLPLNLSENNEHEKIYQQLKIILAQYQLNKEYKICFDLSGRIIKYFTSCCDYHCLEILRTVKSDDFLVQARVGLLDAPILYIFSTLKETIREGTDSLAQINLVEHIQINWDRSQYFDTNDDENDLFDISYINEIRKVCEILEVFKKQWKICYNRIDDEFYSIKFGNIKKFEKFRKHALQLSKTNDNFEGDVMDIVNHFDYANGIVEVKMGRIFDIPNTLAKILGIRNDY